MSDDPFRDAMLRRFSGSAPGTSTSFRARVLALFRRRTAPLPLLDCCIRATNEIVAKACIHIGREFRYPPHVALPLDHEVVLAFAFLVGTIISSSFEAEYVIEEIPLWSRTARHLLASRDGAEFARVVNAGWALSQDVIELRDPDAHNWQSVLALGIDGYVKGEDMSFAAAGGYPELFGNLLLGLIEIHQSKKAGGATG